MPIRRMSASENIDSDPGVNRGSDPFDANDPRSSILSEIEASVVAWFFSAERKLPVIAPALFPCMSK